MRNSIIVFDFETTHINAGDDICDPVELAAVCIHSKNLKPIKGSEFNIVIRPDKIDDKDYYENHKSTIDWHLGLPQNKGLSAEQLMDKWRAGTPEKEAWKMFATYVEQYNYTKKAFTAPIAAGANIKNFDLLIYDRLCKKHKVKPFFFKRDKIDTMELCFYWFSYNQDPPRSHKMDDLRPYFGMAMENAHNAMQDVHQEAELVCYFLRLFKKFGAQIQFRNSYATEKI